MLEVHRPVQPEDAPPGSPVLPPYGSREHDQVLGQVVRAAADGRSVIAVLVGGSCTGKTRVCWKALALLRDQDPPWRLWHPIDPIRPEAALAPEPRLPGGSQCLQAATRAQATARAKARGPRARRHQRSISVGHRPAPVLVATSLAAIGAGELSSGVACSARACWNRHTTPHSLRRLVLWRACAAARSRPVSLTHSLGLRGLHGAP